MYMYFAVCLMCRSYRRYAQRDGRIGARLQKSAMIRTFRRRGAIKLDKPFPADQMHVATVGGNQDNWGE